MRHEVRATERRAPIVPADARRLVDEGFELTVEDSPQRAFALEDYRAAGCRIAPAGSWVGAPEDTVIVGLKELPESPPALRHRHIFFGHAYKGQAGAQELLERFRSGGGILLDVEYLVDGQGRRLVAFGYWAGYVGAALAVLHHRGRLTAPLSPMSRPELDAELAAAADPSTALVIGALGRSGRGAVDALQTAGITATQWDLAETRQLDKAALLDHDILVNCVLTSAPIPPFLTAADLADLADPARRIEVVSDVTCDVTSDCNVLPVNDATTTWDEPVRRLTDGAEGDRHVDIVAIDNLPSLLPAEASLAFSADLLEQMLTLGSEDPAWQRALQTFHRAAGNPEESAHA